MATKKKQTSNKGREALFRNCLYPSLDGSIVTILEDYGPGFGHRYAIKLPDGGRMAAHENEVWVLS